MVGLAVLYQVGVGDVEIVTLDTLVAKVEYMVGLAVTFQVRA